MELDVVMIEFEVYDAFIVNPEELPVVVIRRFVNRYPDVPKYIIVNIVAGYLNEIKVREHCERVGHAIIDDSYGGPEHGYMGWCCTRCGYNEGQYLY